MKIALGTTTSSSAVDLLALLVTDDTLAQDAAVDELDAALEGTLRAALKDEDFTGKKDSTLLLPTYRKIGPRKILLVGLGPSEKVGPVETRAAAARVARVANAEKATTVALSLRDKGEAGTLRAVAEGVTLGSYRFTRYLTGDRKPKKHIERVTARVARRQGGPQGQRRAEARPAPRRGRRPGVNLARDLVNEPPNELTPARLAEAAVEVAEEHGLWTARSGTARRSVSRGHEAPRRRGPRVAQRAALHPPHVQAREGAQGPQARGAGGQGL
jgi:leucyl aminopeptidase